jgi:hypothetical protein
MLFKGVIASYSESYVKPMNTVCEQNAELLSFKALSKPYDH